MLKEKIEYNDELPIKVYLNSIEEYPIHKHDSLEIIHVLQGKVNLKAGYCSYNLNEGDIYIVNTEDLHSIEKINDNSNILLFFHLDLKSFEKYHPYLDKIIFVSNSYYNYSYSVEIDRIKYYLTKIMVEFQNEKLELEKKIVLVNTLLIHLINDFQYYSIEEKKFKNENRFKGDQFQIQRVHRITDHIYTNYMKNITLSEIAEKEHISTYYLSHLVKHSTGYGFRDFLNFVRVEQSEQLLLGSKKPIGEIAYECGFSLHKYYNKHFVEWFKMTPSQYRKKYRDKTIETLQVKYLKFNEDKVISHMKKIIETSDHKSEKDNLENKITIVEIDFSIKGNSKLRHYWNKYIDLWDINQASSSLYKEEIEKFQNEIYFNNIRLNNIIDDIKAFGSSNNLEWLNQFFDLLMSVNINPIISINFRNIKENPEQEEIIEIMNNFIYYYIGRYGFDVANKLSIEICSDILNKEYNDFVKKISRIQAVNRNNIKVEETHIRDCRLNVLYDTEYMSCYIIHNILANNKEKYLHDFSLIDNAKDFKKNNSLFHGGLGLITVNGFKKASYYAYLLLSKLGHNIIVEGNGYIVTTCNENFQVLLYNYNDSCNEFFDSISDEQNKAKADLLERINEENEYIFKLSKLKGKYIVKKYTIDSDCGFAYKHWKDTGFEKYLSKENQSVIKQISSLKIEFSYINDTKFKDIHIKLEPFNVMLLIFEKSNMPE